jgi:hypothetical protein
VAVVCPEVIDLWRGLVCVTPEKFSGCAKRPPKGVSPKYLGGATIVALTKMGGDVPGGSPGTAGGTPALPVNLRPAS